MTMSKAQHRPVVSSKSVMKGLVEKDPNNPNVSVIIVCHNYGRFLRDAINSVLAQTLKPSQILIVDDASTDNTKNIAIQQSECEYLRVENNNCYRSRQEGLEHSTGDYLVFLDADDTIEPTYLEKCVNTLSSNNTFAICTTDIRYFGLQDGFLSQRKDNINRANWLHAGSMVMRSALIVSKAYERDELAFDVSEDWYVWRKVLNYGFTATRINEPLYNYRKHGGSRSDNKLKSGKTYYDWAGLKYENVVGVDEGDGEYVLFADSPVTQEQIEGALRKFWINTAGVVGDGFTIVRRSILKKFPTKDPTSIEWKLRTRKSGLVWFPEIEDEPKKKITAVLMTPLLTVGGAEHWIKMIITLSDPEKIRWKVVLFDSKATHPSIFDPIAERAEMFIVGNGYKSVREAVAAAVIDSDIVVTWGAQQFWPLDVPVPIVMASHGSCNSTANIMKAAFGGATHFTCVSDLSKKLTTTPEMDATVIWNGAEISRLKVTKTPKEIRTSVWGVPNDWWFRDKIFVGYIGRLAQEKNPLSLVDAISELPWQFQCIWVGPGLMKEAMVARASEILKDRFYYTDFADDVGNHYNALDVTVATSHREGNSLALIEAMLTGTPIVTTRAGAVDEFEATAGCPLFYSLPDFPTSNEIAIAVREAAAGGRNASRVIAAQKFAQEHLTGKTMADNWEKYLTGIVKGVPPLY